MRKLMIAAGAAAMLVASTVAALAAEATGTIQSIDPGAGTVTLADGQVFKLPAAFDAAALQVGADVTITYEEGADGSMEASAVTPNS
jgi:Cu/Ag efflux protein CusF